MKRRGLGRRGAEGGARIFAAGLLACLAACLATALVLAGDPETLPASTGQPEESPASLIERARASEARRSWSEAADGYRAALALTTAPGTGTAALQATALAGESRCQLRLEDFKSALAAAERAAGLAPADPEALTALGEGLTRAGELEKALAVLKKAVELAPQAPHPHLGLGRLLIASGQQEGGIAELARAHDLAPDDPEVLFRFAGAAARRRDAVAIYERYLALSEGDDAEKRESVRGTIEFYHALGETPVWVLQDNGSRPGRIEIPLWTISAVPGITDGYVVELTVPGSRMKKLRCLLDSGASGLYLSARAAKKLDLAPLSRGTLFGGGGSERHQTSRALVARLAAGAIEYRNAVATIAAGEVDRLGRFDGILGIDVFTQFRLSLDLERRRLVLEDPVGAKPEASAAGKVVDVQIWILEGQLLARLSLGAGQQSLMMVDTGADRSVLALTAADGLAGVRRRRRSAPAYAFGGEVGKVEEIDGVLFALPGFEKKRMSVLGIDLSRRSRLSGTEISGYLGLDVLREFVLTFEPGQNLVHLRSMGR